MPQRAVEIPFLSPASICWGRGDTRGVGEAFPGLTCYLGPLLSLWHINAPFFVCFQHKLQSAIGFRLSVSLFICMQVGRRSFRTCPEMHSNMPFLDTCFPDRGLRRDAKAKKHRRLSLPYQHVGDRGRHQQSDSIAAKAQRAVSMAIFKQVA